MYHFLKGKIIEKIMDPAGSEKLILEVGGVGYEIQSSLLALNLFGKNGDTCTVYTALIHKEDQMTLVGFPTLMEKELFGFRKRHFQHRAGGGGMAAAAQGGG